MLLGLFAAASWLALAPASVAPAVGGRDVCAAIPQGPTAVGGPSAASLRVEAFHAKRGDVPSTARAYAAAFAPMADAVTVNPYLGYDSLEPFLAHESLGVLALLKTSNPGSADIQDLVLQDGRPLWQHVAGLIDRWGEDRVGASGVSSLGAVVGATHPEILETVRSLLPRGVLLLPGVGAQGGGTEYLAAAFTAGPGSALVSASRSVLYADRGEGWQEAAAAEAERLAGELRAVAVVG